MFEILYFYCIIWASSRENLSLGFPTKRVSNRSPQLQRLARKSEISPVASLHMVLSKQGITKADAQADLHLCCSQTPEDRFCHVKAHIITAWGSSPSNQHLYSDLE